MPAQFDGKHNLVSGCLSKFDANTDYFPEKITIQEASGLEISYHKSYKMITVKKPFWEAKKPIRYVLVQCGAPAPQVEADAIIEVPIRTLATTSTTQLPALVQLGLLKSLVGHSGLKYVHSDSVKTKIAQGKLKELGENELNYETLVSLKPSVLMRYTMGASDQVAAKLVSIGQKSVVNAEYTETTPLGRTEWMKLTAALFNQEAKAEALFGQIKQRYNALWQHVATQSTLPSAFSGNAFEGTWYIAGKNSFIGKFLQDAGAHLAFQDEAQNLTLNFEAVLQRGAQADMWLGTSPFTSQELAFKDDERFGLFKAIQQKRYYFYDGSLFESAIGEPDAVLKDLISIFHPHLLPDHRLKYFTKMSDN